MDFKKATEELMAGMTRGEIADALGVSEASVRQARLDDAAKAHRNPPEGWEPKVALHEGLERSLAYFKEAVRSE